MGAATVSFTLGNTELEASEEIPEDEVRRLGDPPYIKPRSLREPEEALATALRRTAQAADLDLTKIIAHLSNHNKEN